MYIFKFLFVFVRAWQHCLFIYIKKKFSSPEVKPKFYHDTQYIRIQEKIDDETNLFRVSKLIKNLNSNFNLPIEYLHGAV